MNAPTRFLRRAVLSALACAPLAGPAAAAPGGATVDYHVAVATGDDANDGLTPGTAWKTISFALANVPVTTPGGETIVIHVGPGTYDAGSGETFPLVAEEVETVGAAPIEIVSDAGSGATSIASGASSCFVLTHTFQLAGTIENRIERIEGFALAGGNGTVFVRAFGGSQLTVTLRDVLVTSTGVGLHVEGVGVISDPIVGGFTVVTLEDVHASGCGSHGILVRAGSNGAGGASLVMSGSSSSQNGGSGLRVDGDSTSAALADCCLEGNALHGLSLLEGGFGIVTVQAQRTLVAGNQGAGLQLDSGGFGFVAGQLDRCTLAGNADGYVNLSSSNDSTFESCIVFGNGTEFTGGLASVAYTASSVNPTGDPTNLVADPLFVGAPGGDYRLQETSPCIDAGDPNAPADPDGTRADMGARPFDQSAGVVYCTGKVSSLGCVPFVELSGSASASAPGPFLITGRDVVPSEAGLLLYGFQKANLAFHGGRLCIKAPITRTAAKTAKSGGGGCSNAFLRRDFNAIVQAGGDPALTAGATVFAQWRQRDPADPLGFGDALTNAVRFSIAP